MDTYQREAVWRLSKSLQSSGDIIATVSRWSRQLDYAKDAHIKGAAENARRTVRAIQTLVRD